MSDDLVCSCPTPLDVSPIGECQRCRRPVTWMLSVKPSFDEVLAEMRRGEQCERPYLADLP